MQRCGNGHELTPANLVPAMPRYAAQEASAAHSALSRILIKPGDYLPGNMYFTTTRAHQELAGVW